MKEFDDNSLKYLTISPNDWDWGLVVTTVGRQSVAPNEHYPAMQQHPDSYHFKSNNGRVLDEFQMVYITDGSGYFESQSISRQKIEAGTIILLFPGERHSYSPRPSIWLERVLDRLQRSNCRKNCCCRFFYSQKRTAEHRYQQLVDITLSRCHQSCRQREYRLSTDSIGNSNTHVRHSCLQE